MYVEKGLTSIFSGNLIDLCPVGALTSKPFAFTARSWELRPTDSIDILDTLGSFIRIDAKGSDILRILPRYNKDTNEEWISDKIRFCYDGLKTQRLTMPLRRVITNNNIEFVPLSWQEALNFLNTNFFNTSNEIQMVLGDLVDLETAFMAKEFARLKQIELKSMNESVRHLDLRSNYVFQTKVKQMDALNLYLIIGSNLLWNLLFFLLKLLKI
jgi:NADH dehydrogenase (ubiquinone) Fe-S protein 1